MEPSTRNSAVVGGTITQNDVNARTARAAEQLQAELDAIQYAAGNGKLTMYSNFDVTRFCSCLYFMGRFEVECLS